MTINMNTKNFKADSEGVLPIGFALGVYSCALLPDSAKLHQVLDIATISTITTIGFRHLKGLDRQDSYGGALASVLGVSFFVGRAAVKITYFALRELQKRNNDLFDDLFRTNRNDNDSTPPSNTTRYEDDNNDPPYESYRFPELPFDEPTILRGAHAELHQIEISKQIVYDQVPTPTMEVQLRSDGTHIQVQKETSVRQPRNSLVGTSRLKCYRGSTFEVKQLEDGYYKITRRRASRLC